MRKLPSLAAIAALASMLLAPRAEASCVTMSGAEQRARADVNFDGVAVEGPTATGVQRLRVSRYLKGRGSRIVHVRTGVVRRADGTGSITSVSVLAECGQRWRTYARTSPRGVLRTSSCDGPPPALDAPTASDYVPEPQEAGLLDPGALRVAISAGPAHRLGQAE